MFALFLKQPDGRLDFLSDAASGNMAVYLGKHWSRVLMAPVVGFANRADGSTQQCYYFEAGELLEEAAIAGPLAAEIPDRMLSKER
jgi:hypothetical protein